MKKLMLFAVGMICLSQSAFALLAPLNQGAVEIKAILSNEQFQTAFGASEVIQQILKTDSGYSLFSEQHRVDVDVQYTPTDRPGPAKYNLVFHAPVPYTLTQQK